MTGQPLTPGRFIPIGRIREHYTARIAGHQRRLDLLHRQLRLGLEHHLFRHAHPASTLIIVGPIARQIQLITDRQTAAFTRDRQRHRHPAVILLARLAAVLTRHPDRMLALLRKSRVVDDPGHRLAFGQQLGQHRLGDRRHSGSRIGRSSLGGV